MLNLIITAVIAEIVLIILLLLIELFRKEFKSMLEHIYGFLISESFEYALLCAMNFFINMGPSISSVAVVGFFIPIPSVDIYTVLAVLFLGIMMTTIASYISKKIKDK